MLSALRNVTTWEVSGTTLTVCNPDWLTSHGLISLFINLQVMHFRFIKSVCMAEQLLLNNCCATVVGLRPSVYGQQIWVNS